jgi:glycosyltransferase involved in cell wall biosynthesis/GT2 family glycosyltransferase
VRILYAIHDFLPLHRAGSELYASYLAQEVGKRHEVSLLCASYDPTRAHGDVLRRTYAGIAVIEVNNLWRFTAFAQTYRPPVLGQRFAQILDEERPQVLHLHSLLNLSHDLPGLAAARGVPVVLTLHDHTLVCPSGGQRVHVSEEHLCERIEPERCARCFRESPFYSQMAAGRLSGSPASRVLPLLQGVARRLPLVAGVGQRVLAQAPLGGQVSASDIRRRLEYLEQVVAHVEVFSSPSQALADSMAELGIPPEKLRVSPYGLPLLQAPPRPPRNPTAPLRLGFVGTLVWHKGIHVLLEALRSLPPEGWELTIYGAVETFPNYTDRLRDLASGLPVRFHGGFHEDEAPEIYAAMDALVCCSIWPENAPLVIQEASMAGVPVIGARSGGVPELVTDEVNGLIYEPTSAPDLARCLRRLLDEPELIETFRAALPTTRPVPDDALAWEEIYARLVSERSTTKPSQTSTEDTQRASPERVSILLVTKDGIETLPALLDAVAIQDTDLEVEVVAVDSGSRDGTRELLAARAERLLEIPPSQFGHGRTRNAGVELCQGDYVVLIVQDALPQGTRWLHELVAPLRADPRVAGTYARQRPRPNASAVTRGNLEAWLAASPEARRSYLREPLATLTPHERMRACVFDNVCSCLRRSVWEELPFGDVAIAEDIDWGRRVVEAGHHIVFTPRAEVVHSHERSAWYELRRGISVHRELNRLFELETIPTLPALGTAVGYTVIRHNEWLRDEVPSLRDRARQLPRAMALALAWPLGQYLGARAAREGWAHRFRGV